MDVRGLVFIIFSIPLILAFISFLDNLPPYLPTNYIGIIFFAFLGFIFMKWLS